ncbi:MAG TPA: tetratricopeptide repeat protein [Desulfobacterales bacterium]
MGPSKAKTRIFGIRGDILVIFLLMLMILGVYAPVKNFEFITYDDDIYVTGNDRVKAGLTEGGLRWAFSMNDGVYWHPLTWLSHMLDIEIYGLNAGMHHATNLLFHMANSVLLFLILFAMTGKFGRSAVVAILFALHPLNVESVAWVAARKNLLSTFFWMLTILAYLQYCHKPSLGRYGICVAVFTAGLMAKPMLVTLPFALLLLDYWPLQRIRSPGWLSLGLPEAFGHGDQAENGNRGGRGRPMQADLSELVLEKIPFLILAAITIFLYSASVKHLEIGVGTEAVPLGLRFANALVSYWVYIRQMFFPVELAFFYPYPKSIPLWQIVGAAIGLAAVTGLAVFRMRRRPHLFTGWFWFLGTLIPVSGLVQAGLWPATADRFAYVPLIGLFTVLAWTFPTASLRGKTRSLAMISAGLVLVLALGWMSRRQVAVWQDNFSLYSHAIAVTEDNRLAHNNLGNAHFRSGQVQQAIRHYQACLRIKSTDTRALNNLASARLREGRIDLAIDHYESVLQIEPDNRQTRRNLQKIKTAYFRHTVRELESQGRRQGIFEQYRNELHP